MLVLFYLHTKDKNVIVCYIKQMEKPNSTNKTNHYDVVVIGGGASGMMAAGTAAARGKRVLLLEKNKYMGEKLKISGGGRCNITNDESNLRLFLKNYVHEDNTDQFLFSAFSQFNKDNTFEFFTSRGLPLVVEARKRAFPHTQSALDVYHTLEKYLFDSGVTVKTNSPVSKIIFEKEKTPHNVTGVVAGGVTYTADSFIFATGGLSHPETGSTGDGFKWLEGMGHKVVESTPSIVPLAVREEYIHKLAGVSLSFMKVTFFVDQKKSFSKKGKILFTHFGLSGPLILNSARKVKDLLIEGEVTATIDMYPDTDLGTLDKNIVKVFDNNKNKMFKNVMAEIVPEGMADAVNTMATSLLGIDIDTKVHSISKEQRKALVALIKAVPMTITGLMGYDRAVVADGGVPLADMDTKTMRSILYPNVFIIGDLLHINRPSGGFSLQLCWTTGYVAGMNA